MHVRTYFILSCYILSPNSPYSICSNETGDNLLKMINFLIPAALVLCGSLTGKQEIAVHAANSYAKYLNMLTLFTPARRCPGESYP